MPSSVPPAPLSAHPLYLLLQELSGPLLTNGNGGGQEEKVEKEKEGSGQEDQLVINISYACKDSERGRHVVQHVSHAALDTIDALIWSNKSMLDILFCSLLSFLSFQSSSLSHAFKSQVSQADWSFPRMDGLCLDPTWWYVDSLLSRNQATYDWRVGFTKQGCGLSCFMRSKTTMMGSRCFS